MNKVAFVVGNGTSRQELNLKDLVDKGTIYGCNALYRDFDDWDYLITMDAGITEEIRKAEGAFGNGQILVPPVAKHYEPVEYSPFARRRNNTGMLSMEYAIEHGHNMLYLLGVDFILKGDIATDNVYAGTENYGPETHATGDDNFHRMQYLSWFVRQHPNTKFVFVIPDNSVMRVIESENVYSMEMSKFKGKL